MLLGNIDGEGHLVAFIVGGGVGGKGGGAHWADGHLEVVGAGQAGDGRNDLDARGHDARHVVRVRRERRRVGAGDGVELDEFLEARAHRVLAVELRVGILADVGVVAHFVSDRRIFRIGIDVGDEDGKVYGVALARAERRDVDARLLGVDVERLCARQAAGLGLLREVGRVSVERESEVVRRRAGLVVGGEGENIKRLADGVAGGEGEVERGGALGGGRQLVCAAGRRVDRRRDTEIVGPDGAARRVVGIGELRRHCHGNRVRVLVVRPLDRHDAHVLQIVARRRHVLRDRHFDGRRLAVRHRNRDGLVGVGENGVGRVRPVLRPRAEDEVAGGAGRYAIYRNRITLRSAAGKRHLADMLGNRGAVAFQERVGRDHRRPGDAVHVRLRLVVYPNIVGEFALGESGADRGQTHLLGLFGLDGLSAAFVDGAPRRRLPFHLAVELDGLDVEVAAGESIVGQGVAVGTREKRAPVAGGHLGTVHLVHREGERGAVIVGNRPVRGGVELELVGRDARRAGGDVGGRAVG